MTKSDQVSHKWLKQHVFLHYSLPVQFATFDNVFIQNIKSQKRIVLEWLLLPLSLLLHAYGAC